MWVRLLLVTFIEWNDGCKRNIQVVPALGKGKLK